MNNQKRAERLSILRRLIFNTAIASAILGFTFAIFVFKLIDDYGQSREFIAVVRNQSNVQYFFALTCLLLAVFVAFTSGGGGTSGGTKSEISPEIHTAV